MVLDFLFYEIGFWSCEMCDWQRVRLFYVHFEHKINQAGSPFVKWKELQSIILQLIVIDLVLDFLRVLFLITKYWSSILWKWENIFDVGYKWLFVSNLKLQRDQVTFHSHSLFLSLISRICIILVQFVPPQFATLLYYLWCLVVKINYWE